MSAYFDQKLLSSQFKIKFLWISEGFFFHFLAVLVRTLYQNQDLDLRLRQDYSHH